MAFDFSFKALSGNFFDPDALKIAVKKAEARVQSKFGAFVRQRMKTSIKYQDGTAPAGRPPFAHRSKGFTKTKTNKKTGATTRQSRSPLRELIYFARDPAANSVVIGPVLFGPGTASLIERGGTGSVGGRPVRVAPHPFARPAGEAEAKKLPDLLRNMVK